MPKRCPHCQTRPLEPAAATCWYCGKEYQAQPRLREPVRATGSKGERLAVVQRSRCSLRGQADASIVAR